MKEGYAKARQGRTSVWPVVGALWRAVRRDLSTFASLAVNNFFLFVALLASGAFSSGVAPVSAYPFLFLFGLLMLFPLAADPLAKVPAARLGLWPLGARQRVVLRAAALALSPMFWLGAAVVVRATARGRGPGMPGLYRFTPLALLVVPLLTHRLAPAGWKPLRRIPAAGELLRKNLRQMFSVLDTYLAVLLAAIAVAGRVREAGMAMLIALALSTYSQCLFSLDGAAGMARYRLLPAPGWRILLTKDAAYLAILLLLVLPVNAMAGLAAGLSALAIGRYPALAHMLPVQRWRFTSGRFVFGAMQIAASAVVAALAEHAVAVLAAAAGAYALSLWLGGVYWERRSGVRQ